MQTFAHYVIVGFTHQPPSVLSVLADVLNIPKLQQETTMEKV